MVPDANPNTNTDTNEEGGSGGERADRTDGGTDPGFDEVALYAVVRKATEDAILGAVGTLLLVGIAFVVVWVGITVLVSTPNLPGIGFGVLAILLGVYLAAATLGVIPPVREWF